MAASFFAPKNKFNQKAIILGSALGVPRYIYFKLAQFFSVQGFAVFTFDYRGVFESQSNYFLGSEMQMTDWGKRDINAVLNFALEELQPEELIYIGHSCGGQLLGMAPSASKISKAIFIASQSGYWRLWPIPQRWGVWGVWTLIAAIANFFDDFPARTLQLSSVNIPSGVAKQWAQWGKSPNYLWDHLPQNDLSFYQEISFPLLCIGFADDRYFGPPTSVRKLLAYYPATQADLQIISPSIYDKKSIGHFGFLKEEFRNTFWQDLANWITTDLKFDPSPLN